MRWQFKRPMDTKFNWQTNTNFHLKQHHFFQNEYLLPGQVAILDEPLTLILPLRAKAQTIAWSKASFKSLWVKAEVSTYAAPPERRAKSRAWLTVTGVWPYRASWRARRTSLLLSLWVPTRRIAASGQNLFISGIHFSFTFWNEVGQTTLKHTMKTSVSE